MLLLLSVVLLLSTACFAQDPTDGVALTIGGLGGGTTLEVVTATSHCSGSSSRPMLPNTPSGNIEGWVAEYVDNKVYLCGGADLNFNAECYSLNIGQGFWDYSGLLDDAREYSSSIVFNEEMVILGGYNERAGWLDSVEKKTMGAADWIKMDSWKMPRKMFNFCAAEVDVNHIIIVGGNEYGQPYRNLVDILDTDTGTWVPQANLTSGRASLGCLSVTHNGERGLMVTGGCINNCQTHLDLVAFFSYTTRTWTDLPPLNEKRMGHKMAWIDGFPAVVGGYETNIKSSSEFWDGTAWVLHPQQLTNARYAYGMPYYIPKSVLTCA